jgi:thiosulfate/3-mercaptopyruvate sulfurtransferase
VTETTQTRNAPSQAAPSIALVSTDWVVQNLDNPNIRLVEVDVDTSAYDTGHIQGAVGWNWQTDLQRHPVRDIPTKEEWEQLLSRSGIGNDTTVVLYGDNNNWFAAFAYWLFKLYGHQDVRLIDGGRVKWTAESRPLTTDSVSHPATQYQAQNPDPELRALRDEVAQSLGQSSRGLVDVRSPGEFSGELLAPENMPQEGAQRGGHIPGAKGIPWGTAVAGDGTFKSVEELQQIYGGKGITPDKEIIAYCRIGERSAHTWFVLHELLGYPNVRNYDGSWTEWGSLVGAPIETGSGS